MMQMKPFYKSKNYGFDWSIFNYQIIKLRHFLWVKWDDTILRAFFSAVEFAFFKIYNILTIPFHICDALWDLVPFVQFKKREKYPWRSINFAQRTTFFRKALKFWMQYFKVLCISKLLPPLFIQYVPLPEKCLKFY